MRQIFWNCKYTYLSHVFIRPLLDYSNKIVFYFQFFNVLFRSQFTQSSFLLLTMQHASWKISFDKVKTWSILKMALPGRRGLKSLKLFFWPLIWLGVYAENIWIAKRLNKIMYIELFFNVNLHSPYHNFKFYWLNFG